MKRTPLERKRPMWQGKDGTPKKRARIKHRSAKKAAKDEVRRDVLEQLVEERGPWCEARIEGNCEGLATDGHEILPRGRGGDPADPENILLVCRADHDWIHLNPADATARGLLRSAYAGDAEESD